MSYHCRNYLCSVLSGCVCECDYCYEAKNLRVTEELCPQCGYCSKCGRKNEPAYVPYIPYTPQIPSWPQPLPWTPNTPYWPSGPIWVTSPTDYPLISYIGDYPNSNPVTICNGDDVKITSGSFSISDNSGVQTLGAHGFVNKN